jgi:hypothetical protein
MPPEATSGTNAGGLFLNGFAFTSGRCVMICGFLVDKL